MDGTERQATTRREPSGLTAILTGGHTLLLVTAIMLPVSGAIIRWIRFSAAGVGSPERLAVSLPIGELAALGAGPAIVVLIAVVTVVVATRLIFRRGAWISVTLGLLGALPAILVFGPAAAAAIAAMAAAFHFGLHLRLGREWRSAWGMAVLLLVYALVAVAAGLSPTVGRSATYAFESGIAEDGAYIPGGVTGSTLLLLPCQEPGAVLEVRAENVVSVHHARAKPPQDPLTRILTPPGYFDSCPPGDP